MLKISDYKLFSHCAAEWEGICHMNSYLYYAKLIMRRLGIKWMGIVRDGKCPGWEMSGMGIVRDGNCPGWELPGMGFVRDGICPGWDLSGNRILKAYQKDNIPPQILKDTVLSFLKKVLKRGYIIIIYQS